MLEMSEACWAYLYKIGESSGIINENSIKVVAFIHVYR